MIDIRADNCGVIVDQGFNQIQSFLDKNYTPICSLVCLSEAATKDQVLIIKNIGSIRIHIKRDGIKYSASWLFGLEYYTPC